MIVASIEDARTNERTNDMSFEKIALGESGAQAHELLGESNTEMAILVVQEWWGINDVVLSHARELRDRLGATVLVPDLYRGKLGVDVEEAHHLMSNLDWGRAAKELGEAATHLRTKRGAKKVGIVGFCMGGALTLIAAANGNVDACAPFYGIPGEDACDVTKITVPVQGHFGAKDNLAGFSDPEAANKLKEKLTGADQEIFFYDGVGHAFMNKSPQPYDNFEAREKVEGFPPLDEATVDLAWSRLETFFRKHLS